jgi:hypothetical protein
MLPAAVWGMGAPVNLLAAAALGVWMMLAPAVFGATGRAADSEHLVGALAVTFAAVALAEPIRLVRLLNVPLGVWIALAPFVLQGATSSGKWNAVVAGGALALLSLRRGPIRERFGSWDRFVW